MAKAIWVYNPPPKPNETSVQAEIRRERFEWNELMANAEAAWVIPFIKALP